MTLLAETTTSDAGSGIALLIIIGLSLLFYFLPTIVGMLRRVRNLGSVIVINLFLGWTLVGWVVSLAMSMRTVDRN